MADCGFLYQPSSKACSMKRCPRCDGDGSVNTKPSKKARYAYKVALESFTNSSDINDKPQRPYCEKVACKTCSGTGLKSVDIPIMDSNDYNNGNISDNEEDEEDKVMKVSDDIKNSFSQSLHEQNTVVIVGGGIGGCALALALQQRNIPVKVYERDAYINERAQGYGLTMQQV